MPTQPVTRDLPAADKTALQFAELRMLLINGFKVQDDKIESRFVQLEANFELKGEQIQGIQLQVGELVTWKTLVTDRLKTNSIRAQVTSSVDLDHEAKIAEEIVAREALAAKVDDLSSSNAVQLAILTRLDRVFSNTSVKVILTVIATAATTWLASKGLK